MITQAQIEAIANTINEQAILNDDTILPLVRSQYPDIHFTYCLDDDIGRAKAVLETETFNLYLIDGREHCLCLTNNFDVATGVVIAEVIPE